MPAYTKVLIQGRTLDRASAAALAQMEMVLAYKPGSLTIVQGGFNAGRVAASAGTHDGAGAFDLTAQNYRDKVRAGRFVGVAIWYRPRLAGVWGEHVHGIVWCKKIWSRIASAAQRQVYDARHDRTGLAGHYRDTTGAPILRTDFYYGAPVSLALMKSFRSSGVKAPKRSVRHRQVSRVRKALKREGIKLSSPNRTWPEAEWREFERRVLKRSNPNGIPDARALILLGRRHRTFMAAH